MTGTKNFPIPFTVGTVVSFKKDTVFGNKGTRTLIGGLTLRKLAKGYDIDYSTTHGAWINHKNLTFEKEATPETILEVIRLDEEERGE